MQRVVDISTSGVKLSLFRGFLVVSKGEKELGRVAIEDVHILIVHAYGASLTTNLLARLASQGVPVVLCDSAQSPVSITYPLAGNYNQNLKMREQWSASLPLRKQIWKAIIETKIIMQASLLAARGSQSSAEKLFRMAKNVKSGDSTNMEGQAAKFYWTALLGKTFRRERNSPGVNSLLNYGYTIIRSTVGRAIVGAGLHPSIGVGHCHREDSLALADDLMEPFRPLVDATIIGITMKCGEDLELDKDKKKKLASLIALDIPFKEQTSPLYLAAVKVAQTLSRCFQKRTPKELLFFEPLSPIEWGVLLEG